MKRARLQEKELVAQLPGLRAACTSSPEEVANEREISTQLADTIAEINAKAPNLKTLTDEVGDHFTAEFDICYVSCMQFE